MKQGLSGVNSLEGLELWAEKRNLSHHPLVQARRDVLLQCSQDDDSQLYHAQSQALQVGFSQTVKEPQRKSQPRYDFSDTDEEALYHAESQMREYHSQFSRSEGVPDSPAMQLHPTINADEHPFRYQSQTLKDQPAPSTQTSPPASPAMQIEPGFEDRQEPSVMMGSDDTVILPDSPIQVTDSEFDALMYGQRTKQHWITSWIQPSLRS